MNQKHILNLQLYVLPFIMATCLFFYWGFYLKVPKQFIIFSIVVPVLFGAFTIGLCSDKMKFWTYNVPNALKINGSSMHLMGLWYVSTLNVVSVLLSESLFAQTSFMGTLKFVMTFSIIYLLLGIFLDMLNVESGLLIVRNRAARKNAGIVKTVMSYGPYYFGLVGLLFGIESKLFLYLMGEPGKISTLLWMVMIGFFALSLPFIGYFTYVYFRIASFRKTQAGLDVDVHSEPTDLSEKSHFYKKFNFTID